MKSLIVMDHTSGFDFPKRYVASSRCKTENTLSV